MRFPWEKGTASWGVRGTIGDKLFSGWASERYLPRAIGHPILYQFAPGPVQHSGPVRNGLLARRAAGRAHPFVTSIGDYNPNNGPLLNRDAFENGSAGGVFSFDPGDGARTSNIRQSASPR